MVNRLGDRTVTAHVPHGGEADDARAWALSLVGHSMPSLKLIDEASGVFDLGDLALPGLVLYVQPGLIVPPTDDLHSLHEDALQHHTYLSRHRSLAQVIPGGAVAALAITPDHGEFRISRERMRRTATGEHSVHHLLLSDPALLLADALKLPTFRHQGYTYYQRTTLIAVNGRIGKVFHPATPGQDARQALAWLQLH